MLVNQPYYNDIRFNYCSLTWILLWEKYCKQNCYIDETCRYYYFYFFFHLITIAYTQIYNPETYAREESCPGRNLSWPCNTQESRIFINIIFHENLLYNKQNMFSTLESKKKNNNLKCVNMYNTWILFKMCLITSCNYFFFWTN